MKKELQNTGNASAGMISVVIPVFNNEKTILRAIQSVENQTRADLVREIIVVDDGSRDRSGEVVEAYRSKTETEIKINTEIKTDAGIQNEIETKPETEFKTEIGTRKSGIPICLIRQANGGPSVARNAGIRQAAGDYIAFLDADDTWTPNKLQRQANALAKRPEIDLLCGGFDDSPLRILWKKCRGLRRMTLQEYCIKSFIFTSTVLIRRECVKSVGLFDERIHYAEDMNYWQRFFPLGHVYYLQGKVADYAPMRQQPGSDGSDGSSNPASSSNPTGRPTNLTSLSNPTGSFNPTNSSNRISSSNPTSSSNRISRPTNLSDNLFAMKEGRRKNFMILYRSGQIGLIFYILMVLFGEMKYIRLCVLEAGRKARHRRPGVPEAAWKARHIRLRVPEAARKVRHLRPHAIEAARKARHRRFTRIIPERHERRRERL